MEKEYYYTDSNFDGSGFEPFLAHAQDYLRGKRSIPISQTKHFVGKVGPVFFTFSDGLLERCLSTPKNLKKAYEAALKYGFRGKSQGEQNGIFLFREGDEPLKNSLCSLLKRAELPELMTQNRDEMKPVKIVWHNPSGGRIVGAYDTVSQYIHFLDIASYPKGR